MVILNPTFWLFLAESNLNVSLCSQDPDAQHQLQAAEDQPQVAGHSASAAARKDPRRLRASAVHD